MVIYNNIYSLITSSTMLQHSEIMFGQCKSLEDCALQLLQSYIVSGESEGGQEAWIHVVKSLHPTIVYTGIYKVKPRRLSPKCSCFYSHTHLLSPWTAQH